MNSAGWQPTAVSLDRRSMAKGISRIRTRFRGSLVSARWINGVWWDAVDVDDECIVLRPWLRRDITLNRSAIGRVEIERVRIPFHWSTYVSFHHVDGTVAAKIFSPWRLRHFRDLLIERRWIVVDKPVRRLFRK
jgi:hypothetical protein